MDRIYCRESGIWTQCINDGIADACLPKKYGFGTQSPAVARLVIPASVPNNKMVHCLTATISPQCKLAQRWAYLTSHNVTASRDPSVLFATSRVQGRSGIPGRLFLLWIQNKVWTCYIGTDIYLYLFIILFQPWPCWIHSHSVVPLPVTHASWSIVSNISMEKTQASLLSFRACQLMQYNSEDNMPKSTYSTTADSYSPVWRFIRLSRWLV